LIKKKTKNKKQPMKQNNLKPGIFHNFSVDISKVHLNHEIIQLYLTMFWESIMNELNEDQYVLLFFKVLYSDQSNNQKILQEDHNKEPVDWATLGPLQKINSKDKNKLFKILCHSFDLKNEDYKNSTIIKINPAGKNIIKK
jgi:hypothetical protein